MDDYEKYLNLAVRFLSYRPRSEKEMKDYFKKKNAPVEITDQVMAFLKEKKFVNDEEFAKLWVSQRKTLRVKSKHMIKMELLQKGIDAEIIEQVLAGDEEEEGVNDVEQARKLVRNRLQRYKGLTRQELYQKLGGFLGRRGFGWEAIKKSIDLELEKNK